MQIQLKIAEIEAAMTNYVASLGISTKNKVVTVKFGNPQSKTTMFATVDISDEITKATVVLISTAPRIEEPVKETPVVESAKTTSLFSNGE